MAKAARRWHPPVAVTNSRLLTPELNRCEQQAGTEFAYSATVSGARRLFRFAPMIVIGVDLAGHVRKPIQCRTGLVVVAALDANDGRALVWAERIEARNVITLPAQQAWLVDQLLGLYRD